MRHFCPAAFLLTLISTAAYAGSPLDNEPATYIKKTNFGYTPPSASIISFENTEYIKAHPGYFWYKNWFFNIMEIQIMGNDIFSRKETEDPEVKKDMYIHTMYLKFAKAGYLWRFPDRDLILTADLHAGLFYTNDLKNETDIEVENTTRGGGGFSFGLRWTPKHFYLDILASIVGSSGDQIAEIYFDLGWQINDKWKIGIFSESGTRTLSLCENKDDPACEWSMTLSYTALYASWRFYKKWWFAFGFGASGLELGTETNRQKAKPSPAIYLSIR